MNLNSLLCPLNLEVFTDISHGNAAFSFLCTSSGHVFYISMTPQSQWAKRRDGEVRGGGALASPVCDLGKEVTAWSWVQW
jgi:hypothetical protein